MANQTRSAEIAMDLSLRARYGVALLLVVLTMAGVFVVAMGLFIEMVEFELKHDTLARELAEQRALLVRDPDWPGPSGGDITRMVVDEASLGGIAPVLAEMASGTQQELELDGRTYMVGRTDIGDRRLYVLLDIEPVESIERRLVILAAVTTTAAALLAVVLGSALGRRAEGLLERLVRERRFAGEAIHELQMRFVNLRSSSEQLSAQRDLSPDARQHVDNVQHAAERMQVAVDSLAAETHPSAEA
jgi:hypothetical protein